MTANVIGGLLGGIFSEQSPVSNRLNEVISNALEEVEKKRKSRLFGNAKLFSVIINSEEIYLSQ